MHNIHADLIYSHTGYEFLSYFRSPFLGGGKKRQYMHPLTVLPAPRHIGGLLVSPSISFSLLSINSVTLKNL